MIEAQYPEDRRSINGGRALRINSVLGFHSAYDEMQVSHVSLSRNRSGNSPCRLSLNTRAVASPSLHPVRRERYEAFDEFPNVLPRGLIGQLAVYRKEVARARDNQAASKPRLRTKGPQHWQPRVLA